MAEKKTKYPLPVEAFGDLTRDELVAALRLEHKTMSEAYINYKKKLSEELDETDRARAHIALNAAKWCLDYCNLRAIEEGVILEGIPAHKSIGI